MIPNRYKGFNQIRREAMPHYKTHSKVDILTHERRLHKELDPHHRASSLAEVILGGQDGLVNVLGIVLGVAVATSDARIVLTAGLAATFAESVSMGAVAFTSTLAQADLYESERDREYRHIDSFPNHEKDEIRKIFRRKGFSGRQLELLVNLITNDKDVWVDMLMSEEHQLTPTDRQVALRSAVIVGLSALIGSIIPLLPFFFLPVWVSMWVSILVAALVLFGVGAYKARLTVGCPRKSGLEMTVIGIVSALIGYLIGLLLKAPPSG